MLTQVQWELQKGKWENGSENTVEAIMAGNDLNMIEEAKTKDGGSSENTKQNKSQK